MDLAIAQRLVCPRGHPVTPLVARVDRVVDGRVRHGMLGCPQCNAEWDVTDGVARFGDRVTLPAVVGCDATTAAAFLALTEPGVVLVDGAEPGLIDALSREFGAVIVALDPAGNAGPATVIEGAERAPLAPASARGAVLFRPGRDAVFVASAVAALEPSGRMLAAAAILPVPGLRELARDGRFWVAAREAEPVRVPLRRRGA